jgi:hypothetical protein
MKLSQPPNLILIGFFLVLIGWILPLLMVVQMIESTFFLNFFSYAASVVGLFLGTFGAAMYFSGRKKKE